MLPPGRSLASLVPVSGLVHRVLGVAAHGVSEGSRRNARAAIEARDNLTRHGAEVLAELRTPAGGASGIRHRRTG